MHKKRYARTPGSLIFFFIIIITIIFLSQTAYGWDNCPFGEVNESYPGTCGRYIDIDNDNICDLSQPSPNNREISNTVTNSSANQNNNQTIKNSGINYFFIPIAGILFLFYFLTLYLSKKKKIKLVKHRKLWNGTLLITFLISGISGLILAILITYGIKLSFYSEVLFWHVETGIAMAIISIFHIVWHWKYFKIMLPYRNTKDET